MSSPSHHKTTTMTAEQACPSCGADITNLLEKLAQSTQSRISELEAQVRILTDKATAAVDKLADYEDQLHQLKSTSQPARPQSTDHPSPKEYRPFSSAETNPQRSPFQSRLSSLLPSSRRSTSQPPSSAPPSQLSHSQSVRQPLSASSHQQSHTQHHHHHHHQHTSSNPLPSTTDDLHALKAQLENERALRLAAETSLNTTNTEIEELSATLFSEANELVATERRSLHQLQLRYNGLQEEAKMWEMKAGEREKEEGRLRDRVKVLEGREGEKGRRLGELERMVGRVERVRGLLGGVTAGVVEGGVGKEGSVDADGRRADSVTEQAINER
ncbi:MAG: hypothetical protein Q9182_002101 [Xanthomendoza sp. 2 TL-2023]